MKTRLLLIFLSLSLVACQSKKVAVKAFFTTDKTEYTLDEPVIINNLTEVTNGHLGLCHWEWGDGNSSFEQDLRSVTFENFGENVITLTAYADGGGAQDTYSTKVLVKDNIGPVEGALYVSSNGSGDGQTLETPMAFSRFVSILSGSELLDYDGKAFYIQSGTFVLKSSDALVVKASRAVAISITGGFSMGGASGATIFTGEGDHSILSVGANVTLHLTRCTFSGSNGSAVRTTDASSVLNMRGCIFSENQGEYGGALNISKGKATVTNCTFQSNLSTLDNASASTKGGGGAVCVSETGAGEFVNCTFSSNHADMAFGGAVYLQTSKTAMFSNCTFNGNFTDTSIKNKDFYCGGAVCANGDGVYDFTTCVFSGNHTKTSSADYNSDYGGAVDVRGASTIRFNQCRFDSNYATCGGALHMKSAGATTYLNACVFSGNHISYRYGTTILAFNNVGVLCLNNCTFADNNWGAATNAAQLNWINLKLNTASEQFVLSNCSLIGDLRRNAKLTNYSDGRYGLVRFDGGAGTAAFINSIIVPTLDNDTRGPSKALQQDGSSAVVITAVSNKQYVVTDESLYNASGENATDFRGTSDYFGGLSWKGGTSWNDSYWSWNGTLSGGSNTTKASLTDVNNAIRSANSSFYNWLDGIGALSLDGRGALRGATTWPGAYQGL